MPANVPDQLPHRAHLRPQLHLHLLLPVEQQLQPPAARSPRTHAHQPPVSHASLPSPRPLPHLQLHTPRAAAIAAHPPNRALSHALGRNGRIVRSRVWGERTVSPRLRGYASPPRLHGPPAAGCGRVGCGDHDREPSICRQLPHVRRAVLHGRRSACHCRRTAAATAAALTADPPQVLSPTEDGLMCHSTQCIYPFDAGHMVPQCTFSATSRMCEFANGVRAHPPRPAPPPRCSSHRVPMRVLLQTQCTHIPEVQQPAANASVSPHPPRSQCGENEILQGHTTCVCDEFSRAECVHGARTPCPALTRHAAPTAPASCSLSAPTARTRPLPPSPPSSSSSSSSSPSAPALAAPAVSASWRAAPPDAKPARTTDPWR